jgi:hypothetical protein
MKHEDTVTALPTKHDPELPISQGVVDPLVASADSISRRNIVGLMMKFNGQTGQFNCGQEEKRPVPLGACFTVAYDGIMLGWSLWQDKKITNQVIGLAIEGFPMPSRESLEPTFLDRTQWVTRLGKPQDPWQKTY